MQFPDDENGKMLSTMAESGLDLTQAMDVDFFLVFSDKRDAESALEDLIAQDSSKDVEINFNEELEKWELILAEHMVPEHAAIEKKERQLDKFASEYEGMSDGWGVMQHQEGDQLFDDEHDCDH